MYMFLWRLAPSSTTTINSTTIFTTADEDEVLFLLFTTTGKVTSYMYCHYNIQKLYLTSEGK